MHNDVHIPHHLDSFMVWYTINCNQIWVQCDVGDLCIKKPNMQPTPLRILLTAIGLSPSSCDYFYMCTKYEIGY